MKLDYPPGATPLDPDEADGLIPSHIANHGQLYEWKMVNILEGDNEHLALEQRRSFAIRHSRIANGRTSFPTSHLRQFLNS